MSESIDPHGLVNALDDAEQRDEAVNSLREAGPTASEALCGGLAHTSPRVRRWCALLLDEQATPAASLALRRVLDDPSAEVRRVAVHAIGCQPCKREPIDLDVVDLLVERLTGDPSIRVRRVTTHMLGCQPRDPRVLACLRKARAAEVDPKLLRNLDWAITRHQEG